MMIRGRAVFLCGATLVVAAACASGGRRERTGCALRASDSVFTRDSPVFRECAVDRKARLTGDRIALDHPQSTHACQRAVIEFVVGANGAPEIATARVADTNNEQLAVALIESLPQRRYEPARINGLPVRQIVREEHFVGPSRIVVQRADGARPIVTGTGPATSGPGPVVPPGCSR